MESAKTGRKISLVTGACGFIGSHMVEYLKEQGHQVIAADHPSAWLEDDLVAGRYPTLIREWADKTIEFDLTDPQSIAKLPTDVDYVFHLASVFSYTAPWEVLYNVNVEGTRLLVEHIESSKRLKRFVLWGAGGVYGLPSERNVNRFDEQLVPSPSNNYLRSKWEQEFYVMEQGRNGRLDYTIIRPTTVYGPRGGYGARKLFTAVFELPVVTIPKNINGHIPFIHVVDVARSALFLAESDAAKNEIFNLNDDTVITNVEFMLSLARILGKPFFTTPPVPLKTIFKTLDPAFRVVQSVFRDVLHKQSPIEPDLLKYMTEDWYYDNAKLKATGFEFKYPDARAAFAETVSWYLNHGQA